jgi:hypothetical protein
MRKLTAVLSLTVVTSVAACADTPTGAIAPVDVALSQTTVPTANGPVWVIGYFAIGGAGGGLAGVNKHPQGFGSCRDEEGHLPELSDDLENFIFWHAPNGQRTSAKFCRGSDGTTGTVACTTDSIPATYAFGGASAPDTDANAGGNENLNFTGVEWGEQGVFVHYNSSRDRYKRQGTLTVDYSCLDNSSGTATIHFSDSEFLYIDSQNRMLAEVDFNLGGATEQGTLEWEYRSRNDIPQTTP